MAGIRHDQLLPMKFVPKEIQETATIVRIAIPTVAGSE